MAWRDRLPQHLSKTGLVLAQQSSRLHGVFQWRLQASLYVEPALKVSRKIPPHCPRQTPQLPPLPQDLYSGDFGSKRPNFNRDWKEKAHDLSPTITRPKQIFFFKIIFHFSTLLVAQVSSNILPPGWNYTWLWFFPCLLTHTFSFLLLSLRFENKTSFQHFALTIKAAAKGYDLQICQVSEEPRSNRDQTESAFPAATLQLCQPLEYLSPAEFFALHSLPWKGGCYWFYRHFKKWENRTPSPHIKSPCR